MKKLMLATLALITLCLSACDPESVTLDCQSNMSVSVDGCIENEQGELVPNVVLTYFLTDGCLAPSICFTNLATGERTCLPELVSGSEQQISLTNLFGGSAYTFILEAVGSYIEQGLTLSLCEEENDNDQGGGDGVNDGQNCSSTLRTSSTGCQANDQGVQTPSIDLTYSISSGCTGMTLCYTNNQNTDRICFDDLILGQQQQVSLTDLLPETQYRFVLTNGSITLSSSNTASSCN
ncbi:MAG: hypothetical protein HRU41_09370 [Saprospiraceae bacterium]|nr:hypothetical protein [Saprospiraceae bacterium]